jgi:hypothetical protein
MFKNIAIIGVLVIMFLSAFVYEENRRAVAARPPEEGANLITFLEARPNSSGVRKFVHNNKVYIEVLGEVGVFFLSVPSGPPAYIFDETGLLVDWTGDRGDDAAYKSKWGSLGNGMFISIEDAKQIILLNRPEYFHKIILP